MRFLFVLSFACLLAIPCTATPPARVAAVSSADIRQALYDYDRTLPLDAAEREAPTPPAESAAQRALRRRVRVEFTSVHDCRVPAILTLPVRFGPRFPAVLILAGSGGHKDTDYVRIAADIMASLGYASLSIDTQYHGERSRAGRTGDIHLIDSSTNRDAWVQTVVDLRRAVDYLASRPDIDTRRLGYLGFSQGGMIGGTFVGVEPRLRCAVLAVAGGGLVEWGRRTGLLRSDQIRRSALNAAMVDPVHFVGRFAPRPLLMLSATRDEMIPRFATQALYDAAGAGRKLVWFPSGHILPPAALLGDARRFLIEHLGIRKELH